MEELPKHPDVARIFTRLLDSVGLNAAQFARKIGSTPQAISNYMVGRNEPGRKMLAQIIAAYPTIDAAWLASGKGEPFPAGVYNQLPPPVPNRLAEPTPADRPLGPWLNREGEDAPYWRGVAAERLTRIERLEATIDRLWDQNGTLLKKTAASAEAADLRADADDIMAAYHAEEEDRQYRIAAQSAYGAVQGRWVGLPAA